VTFKHIISVDPGDVNNGFCYFKYDDNTKKADLKIMEILGAKGLSDLLKVIWGIGQTSPNPLDVPSNPYNMFFVIENFRMDSHVRGAIFQWSELLTSQMIGRVKLCAEWMDAPVFMQEPRILVTGRKYCPFPLPKGHIPDDKSAFIHGAHFMISRKLISTVDQITIRGQEKMF
jgi:hypothetical protein